MADLAKRVATELRREAPEAARIFVDALEKRFGDSLVGVVFYGSCLRNETAEGVLDFYALVEDYRIAYPDTWRGRALAAANAVLAPNVFYQEIPHGDATRRAKVAVMRIDHFEAAVAGRWWRPGFWARFGQPALAVWTRDAATQARIEAAVATAVRTAIDHGLAAVGPHLFGSEDLWQALFARTYGCELRPERDDTIASLYRADPARYDAMLDSVLDELAEHPGVAIERIGDQRRVRGHPAPPLHPRLAKLAAAAQLLKSAFTFGDWLPYALWKLERHTGTRLEPTARQRRYPLLFAWPLVARALAARALR